MKILLLIMCIVALNDLWLFVFCRLMEKLENNKKIKRNCNVQTIEKAKDKNTKKHKENICKTWMRYFMYHYGYGWMRYCCLLNGRIPSNRIRNIRYRLIFNMKITKQTVIYGGCEFRSPWNIRAGNCVISSNCLLDGRNGIYIGENVVFGGGVHIWTEEHNVNSQSFDIMEENRQPVIIHEHAWICSDSTILPGVTIGEGAVVATRACVTKDCEAFTINAGIPAKKIGDRNNMLTYTLSGKPHWHFY